MFGMGIGELLLIFVIALLVFGPDKLPQVARTTGKFMRDLKRTANDIRYTIEREINLSELQQTLDLPEEVKRSMQDVVLPPDEVERRRREKIRQLKEGRSGPVHQETAPDSPVHTKATDPYPQEQVLDTAGKERPATGVPEQKEKRHGE